MITTWVAWCFLHSILISRSVTKYIQSHLPGLTNWYRIIYNCFSLLTLALPIYFMTSFVSPVVFRWVGIMQLFRILLILMAIFLFREGAKKYDFGYFLGIQQILTGKSSTLLGDEELFQPNGIFGIIRHPWYSGALLLIWSFWSEYTVTTIIVSTILSGYFVIGTVLEERKILTEYGTQYSNYQQNVSMLFPWKWIRRHLK